MSNGHDNDRTDFTPRSGGTLTAPPPIPPPPPAPGWADDGPPAFDRAGAILRAWWLILMAAVVVAGTVFAVCQKLPPTYKSTATIQASVPPTSNLNSQSVQATGDLAGQYANLATLAPVLNAASRESKIPAAKLRSGVSAGTVSNQGLISVSAESSTGSQAAREANAVAVALTQTINAQNKAQSKGYMRDVQAQLRPLNQQIARVSSGGGSPSSTAREGVLSSLLSERQQIAATLAQNAAAQPGARLFATADAGSKVQPRP